MRPSLHRNGCGIVLTLVCFAWSGGCGDDADAGWDVEAGTIVADADAGAADGDAAHTSADASVLPLQDASGVADGALDARSGRSETDASGASDTGAALADASDAAGSGTQHDAAIDAGGPDAGADASKFPALPEDATLFVAGDSTSAIFPASDPTKRVGWASVLQSFFGAGLRVDDAAQSGRSSKSFLDEGLWKALKAKIRPGDYVFVQFGHNDEKTDDPARYTDPATSFRTNLKTYVLETRAAGGVAVLLTPISRRQFSGSKIVASHGAYPAAVMAVAAELGAPCIDMTEKTRVLLESLGPSATLPLFATGDNTHLSAQGAREVAKLAVQGMRELALPLVARLAP